MCAAPEKLEQRAKPKRRKQHLNDDGSLSSCGDGVGGGGRQGRSVLFSPSVVAQQLAATTVGGGRDGQTSPVSPPRRGGVGFGDRYNPPPPNHPLHPSQQQHPAGLPNQRLPPPPSHTPALQLGEQDSAASRTLSTVNGQFFFLQTSTE